MENKIHIREPYYSAGKKYWANTDYKPIALGINRKHLLDNKELLVTVADSPIVYKVDKEKSIAFCKQQEAYEKKQETWVIIVPFCEPFITRQTEIL